MNFYSCLDLPRAEARIHEKKSNYLKAILENHQNRSTINRRRAADLPYLSVFGSPHTYLDSHQYYMPDIHNHCLCHE